MCCVLLVCDNEIGILDEMCHVLLMKSCSFAVEKKIRQSTDALNMLSILPWFRSRVSMTIL